MEALPFDAVKRAFLVPPASGLRSAALTPLLACQGREHPHTPVRQTHSTTADNERRMDYPPIRLSGVRYHGERGWVNPTFRRGSPQDAGREKDDEGHAAAELPAGRTTVHEGEGTPPITPDQWLADAADSLDIFGGAGNSALRYPPAVARSFRAGYVPRGR